MLSSPRCWALPTMLSRNGPSNSPGKSVRMSKRILASYKLSEPFAVEREAEQRPVEAELGIKHLGRVVIGLGGQGHAFYPRAVHKAKNEGEKLGPVSRTLVLAPHRQAVYVPVVTVQRGPDVPNDATTPASPPAFAADEYPRPRLRHVPVQLVSAI